MIVDASVLIAILRDEPEAGAFKRALALAPIRRISPVNWFEAAINAQKAGRSDMAALEKLCERLELAVVPIDDVQMRLALRAWTRYGKGRDPARLNLGDCFAYALAKHANDKLLYKGGDFARTDIAAAI